MYLDGEAVIGHRYGAFFCAWIRTFVDGSARSPPEQFCLDCLPLFEELQAKDLLRSGVGVDGFGLAAAAAGDECDVERDERPQTQKTSHFLPRLSRFST